MSRFRLLLFTILYTCMFSAVGFSQDASIAADETASAANDETLATDARADESNGDEVAAAASFADTIDDSFGVVVGKMATVLFWQPLIVLVLLFGSIFFTFYHGWFNVRGFKHAPRRHPRQIRQPRRSGGDLPFPGPDLRLERHRRAREYCRGGGGHYPWRARGSCLDDTHRHPGDVGEV